MSDRCRNRNCRQSANMIASMPPMASNDRPTPNCRPNSCDAQKMPYPHAMMKRLQALDFSIVDTVLYLDAYPHCQKALNYYHELIGERDELLRTLAEQYHTPVTNFENFATDHWDWIAGPWPWELSANG